MKRRRWFLGLAGLGCLALALHSIPSLRNPLPVQASTVPGTGTLSGRVEAPKPFPAAQVYARNLDQNILYMVYTNGGRYQAVNLFPGNYDVTVQKRGWAADPKKLAVKAGENSTANFRMREGAIWYNPRSSENGAVGVLYPDVSKMTTLAAYY